MICRCVIFAFASDMPSGVRSEYNITEAANLTLDKSCAVCYNEGNTVWRTPMNTDYFVYYLIAINVIGFILSSINAWLYAHTADKQIDGALSVSSLLGGSVGVLIPILLFNRKIEKRNVMSRVFIICIFVIQILLILMIKGFLGESITFDFLTFFKNFSFIPIYWGVINLITFIVFGIDKLAAIKNRSRIKIVTLLGLSFIGGSVGGLLGMYLFRHKTQKDYFTVGIPLMLVMQAVFIFFLMNVLM